MKFLDKKEQVIDFKLTSYGHYLLSIGEFDPEFYAFFDDGILYDTGYANFSESANVAHNRIKHETQYLQTQTLFEEVEVPGEMIQEGSLSYYDVDTSPILRIPKRDMLKVGSPIGDAFLEGNKNIAPAWKIVVLNGAISSSLPKDEVNDVYVPQVNIDLNYKLKTIIPDYIGSRPITDLRRSVSVTDRFADGKVIELVSDELFLYVEELNTILLNDNFDVEVFEILTASLAARCPTCEKQDKFERLYFQKEIGKLQGEAIDVEYITEMNNQIDNEFDRLKNMTSSSVGYYFQIVKDALVNKEKACKGVESFNKKSLYVTLDFDCQNIKRESDFAFVDIYGSVTEPESCQ